MGSDGESRRQAAARPPHHGGARLRCRRARANAAAHAHRAARCCRRRCRRGHRASWTRAAAAVHRAPGRGRRRGALPDRVRRRAGSVAAPTAGLHFTPALLDGASRARGVGASTCCCTWAPGRSSRWRSTIRQTRDARGVVSTCPPTRRAPHRDARRGGRSGRWARRARARWRAPSRAGRHLRGDARARRACSSGRRTRFAPWTD